VTVTGDVTISPVSTSSSGGGFGGTATKSGQVTLLGNLTGTSLAATQPLMNGSGTNALVFGGGAAQTLTLGADATVSTGATLRVTNPTGLALGGSARTATIGAGGVLDLGASNLMTGDNTIGLANGASLSRTTGRVVGRLRKSVAPGPSTVAFEIGSATDDTPVAATFGNVLTGGTLTASTTAGQHPQVAVSGIDASKSLNRWFTLEPSALAFDSCTVSFGFPAAAVLPGASLDQFLVRRGPGIWTSATPGAHTATSFTAHEVVSLGDFVLGEGLLLRRAGDAAPGGTVSPAGTSQALSGPVPASRSSPSLSPHRRMSRSTACRGGPVTAHTFDLIAANHTISATFAIDRHDVVASRARAARSRRWARRPSRLRHDAPFTITPDLGHHVVDVLVDGVSWER
jgi:hypothetical protein